jgi:BED zinc finger
MSSKNSMEFSFHKSEGAWEYFLRERFGQCAQCKLCKVVIKTVGGSTKGLHIHLETKHSINVRKRASPAGKNDDSAENERATDTAKRVNTMDNYRLLKRDDMSFPATISRMAACDGFPFLTFVNSKDLRRSLAALGFREIPKSPNGIRKIVVDHGNQIRTQTIAELEDLKKDGAELKTDRSSSNCCLNSS